MSGHPYAQWFSPLGKCPCGKAATGHLMTHRNDNAGPRCEPCAKREIKAAHKMGKVWPDEAIRDSLQEVASS